MSDSANSSIDSSRGRGVTMIVARGATEQDPRARTIFELRELIAALDRRVPQVERVGEIAIARAAAAIRIDALERIEELEHEASIAASASVVTASDSRPFATATASPGRFQRIREFLSRTRVS